MSGMRRFYLKLNKELKADGVFLHHPLFYEIIFHVCEVHAYESDTL